MSQSLQEWQGTEDQLSALGAKLVSALGLDGSSAEDATTIVWLHGDMGMGKTTIVGHILRAIGLPPGYPVNSPTFSLVNEYPIAGQYYAHLDLYRLADSGGIDEGLLEHREFSGVFIEWPTAVDDLPLIFPADYHLVISGADQQRRYQLFDRSYQHPSS